MPFPTENEMLRLFEIGKKNNSITLGDIMKYFNIETFDNDKIDEIGFHLQVFRKKDTTNVSYLHGHILHFALINYLKENVDIKNVNIFETGTARGFSSIIMAHTLDCMKRDGIINTFDIKHYNSKTESECLCAAIRQQKVSCIECIEPFKELVEKYIKFNVGDTNKILKTRETDRIHFAFLDGDHKYSSLKLELNYVSKTQKSGDIIIVDDYSVPELGKATDEFLENGSYIWHILEGRVGVKTRKYIYLKKK
tara:strand:- start:502 stop:1257 length:756 start_codon:yes stop_codon:yes gene_type:complete